ncbi:poly-beta-1,6-N-acetyl-D-glucosamine biosynthesis protein PgaD [Castellaniella caeni]|uniref:poly-beta-1,6-N-acetyl-D-glucosamine biosynthesis protein PgaD n=1 Tax=Castellaniella caeni TaxID=266123 RepID=UPI0008302B9D|nr:poly-beta-1,6-N-acetyl-D-glucosamine biosynthesis protein PgaD [Castellaniella caeni]
MIIIKTARSRLRMALEGLLTALVWGACLSLFSVGIRSIAPGTLRGLAGPLAARLPPGLHTLLLYALVALGVGVLLFSWASYNALRYGGLDRRKSASTLTRQALAQRFGIDAGQLDALRDSQIVHILHDETGNILQLRANDENSNTADHNRLSPSRCGVYDTHGNHISHFSQ